MSVSIEQNNFRLPIVFPNIIQQSHTSGSTINSNLLPLDLQLLNWIEYGQDISINQSDYKRQTNKIKDQDENNKETIYTFGIYDIKEILFSDFLFIIYQSLMIITLYCQISQKIIDFSQLLVVTLLYQFSRTILSYSQFKKTLWVQNLMEKQQRKLFFLMEICRLSFGFGVLIHFQSQCENGLIFLFFIPIGIILRFIYQQFGSSKQQLVNLFFFSIEILMAFIASLKMEGLISVAIRQLIMIPLVYMIYKFILGFFVFILLLSSIFNLFYRFNDQWKLRALWVISVMYIGQGLAGLNYIHFAIIQEKTFEFSHQILSQNQNLATNQNNEIFFEILSEILNQHFLFLVIQVLSIIVFKAEYKFFMEKIIYWKLLKKEICISYFQEVDQTAIQQVSQIYYQKLENFENEIRSNNAILMDSDKKSNSFNQCRICFEGPQCILMLPCYHSGLCRQCLIDFIKQQMNKCPFCKASIEKFYVFENSTQKKQKIVVGEIRTR